MSKAKDRVPRVEDANVTPATKKMPRIGRLVSCFFFIMLIIFGCYAYSMTGDYVFNDITNFRSLKNATDFGEFWLNLFQTALSSPLSEQWLKATYAWDLQSFGLVPGWSHAVNICLHLCTCLYFYVFVFRISWRLHEDGRTKLDPYIVAASATGLLACHPLVTGSVGYISGRAGVLGAANYFLALNCFLYGFLETKLDKAFTAYALFFFFVAVGMASNIQCFSLPYAAVALCLLLKPAAEGWRSWIAERSWEIGMFLAVGLGTTWLLTFPNPLQVDNGFGLAVLPPQVYWATQCKLLLTYYLRCTVFPIGLSISPPHGIASGWSDIGAIGGALMLVATPLAAILSKRPLLQLAGIIFALTLFPWFAMVQPEFVADYRFYLPLSAICLAASQGVAYLAGIDFKKSAIAAGIIVALLCGLTIWRNVEWATDKHLWRAEVLRNPKDARMRAFLAQFFMREDKDTETRVQITQALRIDPNDFLANSESGLALYGERSFYQSSLVLIKAIEIGKKLNLPEEQLATVYVNLARDYWEMGKLDQAAKNAQIAFKYLKADPFLYFVIGKKQIKDKQPLLALRTLEDGYKRDPTNPDFLEPIAEASLDTRMTQLLQSAYVAARKSARITHHAEAMKLLIRACLEMGKIGEAKVQLESLNDTMNTPEHSAETKYLWSVYHSLTGDQVKAASEKKEALAAAPDLEKRLHLRLAIKPGAEMPAPDIVPKGVANPTPDISRIDPKIRNILAPGAVPGAKVNPNNSVESSPNQLKPATLAPNQRGVTGQTSGASPTDQPSSTINSNHSASEKTKQDIKTTNSK